MKQCMVLSQSCVTTTTTFLLLWGVLGIEYRQGLVRVKYMFYH